MKALEALNENGFPEAVIAGGAIRDLYHNVAVKDVDIFLPYRPDRLTDALNAVYDGGWRRTLGAEEAAYTEWITELYEVHEPMEVRDFPSCDLVKAPPAQFQVIMMNDQFEFSPMNVLRRMDFGMCQIAFDSDGYQWTYEFMKDYINNSFTVCRSDNTAMFNRSLERFRRFQEKYPSYKLVVPPQFTHLVGAA